MTIVHELGHIFCGHLGDCGTRAEGESGWPDRRFLGKHEKEVEAEAVAYLVVSRAGLSTASPLYLKPHIEKLNIDQINLELIVRAAARVERLAKIHYGSMIFSETK